MPELPEVETVRRGIEPTCLNGKISEVEIRRPDLRWPFPNDMKDRLMGATITNLRRRSKYLLLDTDRKDVWLIHLGMSGRLSVSGRATANFHTQIDALEKHDHVFVGFISGYSLTYNDPRRFGAMDVFCAKDEPTHPLIKTIGPEPLGNYFDGPYLSEKLFGKTASIKSALLDQRVVAGLGNIYVCEALWRAGIHPTRPAGKISAPRLENLVAHIREVLRDAIAAGGSSLNDYRQADGELGYFQHRFAVYDQEGERCKKTDCKGTIKRIVQSGRSSYHCSKCQR